MTEEVKDWLPADAVLGDAVHGALEDAIGGWSTRWFANGQISVANLALSAARLGDALNGTYRIPKAFIAIGQSRTAPARILERALDMSVEGLVLTDVDRSVITPLVDKIIDDLAVTIETLLETGSSSSSQAIEGSAASQTYLVIHLAEDRRPILSLAIPTGVMVRFCKRLSPRTPVKRHTDNLLAALGPVSVTIEATIGVARMSLADLSDLAVGDVVVLDAALEDGGQLVLPDTNTTIARATLGDVDDHLALTVHR